MSATENDLAVDAATLAWHADRLSLHALEPERRAWFENVARYVEGVVLATSELIEDTALADDEDDLDRALEVIAAIAAPLELAIDTEDLEGVDLEGLKAIVAERLVHAREEGAKDATIPSRANALERKAMRLLVDGDLQIVRADEKTGFLWARCRGTDTVYDLGYDPSNKTWRCTCEASAKFRNRCSHVAALQIIAKRPRA